MYTVSASANENSKLNLKFCSSLFGWLPTPALAPDAHLNQSPTSHSPLPITAPSRSNHATLNFYWVNHHMQMLHSIQYARLIRHSNDSPWAYVISITAPHKSRKRTLGFFRAWGAQHISALAPDSSDGSSGGSSRDICPRDWNRINTISYRVTSTETLNPLNTVIPVK